MSGLSDEDLLPSPIRTRRAIWADENTTNVPFGLNVAPKRRGQGTMPSFLEPALMPMTSPTPTRENGSLTSLAPHELSGRSGWALLSKPNCGNVESRRKQGQQTHRHATQFNNKTLLCGHHLRCPKTRQGQLYSRTPNAAWVVRSTLCSNAVRKGQDKHNTIAREEYPLLARARVSIYTYTDFVDPQEEMRQEGCP